MEDFLIFKLFVFLFYDIRLSDTGIIISECKEVLLFSKVYEYY